MKTGILAIIAIVLVGIGYALYSSFSTTNVAENPTEQNDLNVQTARISEETTEYNIDLEYPQFGIPAIDTRIRAAAEDLAGSLKAQAESDKPVENGFRRYELTGGFDQPYIGTDVVSVQMTAGQDFGGAHPLPIIITFNFDRATGKELTLDDALAMIGRTLAQVSAGAKAQLNSALGDDVIAPEGADPNPENYQTFFIGPSSVTFIFQPYQVAPYAAGAPEVSFARTR